MDIKQAFNDVQVENLPEEMADLKVAPEIAGQFLMEVVGNPDDMMTLEDRLFWMQVEHHIGPDYLAKLRHVVAFMAKVGAF